MPARYCPQCGQEVSSSARFCANCAAPLTAPNAAAPSPVMRTGTYPTTTSALAPLEAPPKSRPLIPILATIAVILLIAVAALGARLHHDSVLEAQSHPLPEAAPLLSAPSNPLPSAPPLLSAPSHPLPPSPPLTNAPSTPGPQMPADVAAYLKFLQGIEARRVALSNDAGGAMSMLQTARTMQGGQDDPEEHNDQLPANKNKISSGYSDYNAKWQTLMSDFRAVTPPDLCQNLAGQYYNFLSGYIKTISSLQVAVMNGDLGSAMGAQGEQKQINDQALAADDALGQLCSQYGVHKPFSIQADGASSSLIGP